eukprot:m.43342 g.43342  ORF g.43342 m.43342 type:complete len:52 (+) comp10777_c0_seq2:76-231(+)
MSRHILWLCVKYFDFDCAAVPTSDSIPISFYCWLIAGGFYVPLYFGCIEAF